MDLEDPGYGGKNQSLSVGALGRSWRGSCNAKWCYWLTQSKAIRHPWTKVIMNAASRQASHADTPYCMSSSIVAFSCDDKLSGRMLEYGTPWTR